MYKKEIKAEVMEIYKSTKNIDTELVKIKVAIHNLEKLGHNTDEIYKQLEMLGLSFYQFKKNVGIEGKNVSFE